MNKSNSSQCCFTSLSYSLLMRLGGPGAVAMAEMRGVKVFGKPEPGFCESCPSCSYTNRNGTCSIHMCKKMD